MTDKYILEGFEAWLSDLDVPSSGMCIGRLNEYRTHMCKVAFEAGFKASQSMCSKRLDDMRSALIDALDDVGSVLQDYEGALPYKKERYAAQKAFYENIERLIAINSTDKGEG